MDGPICWFSPQNRAIALRLDGILYYLGEYDVAIIYSSVLD
jgi:hypothetical protein